ncbi:relaxase/mobilization nuclease domain-containing protein [Luteolibacter pohnpeiensis]|uniref:Relaxase/mobilization nuclease domain-containing protein n=1 Tax=Luteolibacter pohnpeiensis TaxID=454153 RepID=A0A934SDB1_9BACT|nr:relaxase/mobilization nuclease domain-containing protein [Luteolibacter pohnpeiensis]MBK1883779.1 relaxase/mobilization nuclease domain-containing protein [Luteolibacter pohnpeiensis]
MVPFITKGGESFRRAWAYFCHDKGAPSSDRVEWIEYRNLMTDSPSTAWKMMEYTYRSRNHLKTVAGRGKGGRNVTKPCISYSLSWHPDETPDRNEMLSAAVATLEALEIQDHQAMIICHNDEPHPHVHIVVNRIHPLTGLAATMANSKRKLSAFALDYEQHHGVILCQERVQITNLRKKESRLEF